MDCSTPGLPVPHYLLEFAQVHVHWVSDPIQPSYPLPPSSPLDPMDRSLLGSLFMSFPRQEYWSGLPFLLQGIFPNQGLNLPLLHSQVGSLPLSHQGRGKGTITGIKCQECWVRRRYQIWLLMWSSWKKRIRLKKRFRSMSSPFTRVLAHQTQRNSSLKPVFPFFLVSSQSYTFGVTYYSCFPLVESESSERGKSKFSQINSDDFDSKWLKGNSFACDTLCHGFLPQIKIK